MPHHRERDAQRRDDPPRRRDPDGAAIRRRRSRTIFETRSRLSGRVRVIDHGRERRLMVSGETLSVYPLDGDWSRVEREYWWRALTVVELPPRPTVLLVGLGGGTQIHLLRRLRAPRVVTVIERDPIIVQVANAWFGLETVGKLEIVCAEADAAVEALTRAERRFDFIMEDAAYAEEPEAALPRLLALAPLVTPRGSLVVNRHRHGDPRVLARALRRRFHEVRLRRVRRTGENALICCTRPKFGSQRGTKIDRPFFRNLAGSVLVC